MQSKKVEFELSQRTLGYALLLFALLWIVDFSPALVLLAGAAYFLGWWPFKGRKAHESRKVKNDAHAEEVII